MVKHVLFVLMFGVLLSGIAHSGRSIGEVSHEKNRYIAEEGLSDIPINKWLGKKFIFLETFKSTQKYGYQSFSLKKSNSCWGDNLQNLSPDPILENTMCQLKYDKFVGKIITAIEIEKDTYPGVYTVTFDVEGFDKKIYGRSVSDNIHGIALLKDLEKAKKQFLGKTIYSKIKFIRTYDEATGKGDSFEIKKGEVLKVRDIWWGFSNATPLWFIVETKSGKQGYISSGMSWTNVFLSWWRDERPWEGRFFDFNPSKKYKWDAGTWERLNEGVVIIGMTKKHVEVSWGYPKKINKDIYQDSIREQWIYENNQYVYFTNDIVTTIQNN